MRAARRIDWEMGRSGLGPLRAALFPFLFYDGMFGGGSDNAAVDL